MPRLNKLRILENYNREMSPEVFIFHVGSRIPDYCSKLEQEGNHITIVRLNI